VEGDLASVVTAVRRVLAEIDPAVPAVDVQTTGQSAAAELSTRRAMAALTGFFGGAALILVGLGLHGLVVQEVQSRRRELGIRLALGADARQVVSLTVGRALGYVALGMALGAPGGLFLLRLIRNVLFDTSPFDGAMLALVSVVVLGVGATASFLPAFRAGRIHPLESLRSD
jgi:ABC-type antimicrobial peptide transport system permease subunit